MENAQLKIVVGDDHTAKLKDMSISDIIDRDASEVIVRHKITSYFKDDSEQPNKFGKLGDILKRMSGG